MAISVTSIGTNNSAVSNTSLAITVPAGGVPSGALIAAFIHTQSTSGAPSATDTASNTYSVVGQQSDNNSSANGYSAMLYAKNVTALSSGNTITISYATATQKQISAIYATGIDTTAPLDTSVTAVAFGSSTSPSVTSGTPSVSGELFVAWNGINNAFGSTVTNDTANGWTAPFAGFGNGGTRHYIGYQVNSGASAKTYAPVWNNAGAWSVGVAGFKEAVTGTNGTASITEAGDTASSAGVVTVVGAASITEAGDTVSSAGAVTVVGSAAITEAGDTVSSAGTVAVKGTAAITEAGDTVSSAGTVSISGAASITEAGDTSAAAGTVSVTGSASITEADDTVSASGGSGTFAQASITEADDTASSAGVVAVSGAASITEAGDSLASEGVVTGEVQPDTPRGGGGFVQNLNGTKAKRPRRKDKKIDEFLGRILDEAEGIVPAVEEVEPEPALEPEPMAMAAAEAPQPVLDPRRNELLAQMLRPPVMVDEAQRRKDEEILLLLAA